MDSSQALTASEKHAIQEEKKAAAKHMRDLNMLLAGTIDPRDVEFVFTEPEEAQFDNEPDGMGRRTASTGSLHSRFGREKREKEERESEERDKAKFKDRRATVARSLAILEKVSERHIMHIAYTSVCNVTAANTSLVATFARRSIRLGGCRRP